MHQVCGPRDKLSGPLHKGTAGHLLTFSCASVAMAHTTTPGTHLVGSRHRASPVKAAATSKMRRLRAMWKSLVTTASRLRPLPQRLGDPADTEWIPLGDHIRVTQAMLCTDGIVQSVDISTCLAAQSRTELRSVDYDLHRVEHGVLCSCYGTQSEASSDQCCDAHLQPAGTAWMVIAKKPLPMVS